MSIETQLADVVALAIKSATAPLLKRIAELEVKALEKTAPVIGPQGAPGSDGKDGASISTGLGPPTSIGRTGDVYFDAKTWDVYQCR